MNADLQGMVDLLLSVNVRREGGREGWYSGGVDDGRRAAGNDGYVDSE
jgi:hypothetical protein